VGMGMGQFFPSGYGYGFMCPLGTLPTAIPNHRDWTIELNNCSLCREGGIVICIYGQNLDLVLVDVNLNNMAPETLANSDLFGHILNELRVPLIGKSLYLVLYYFKNLSHVPNSTSQGCSCVQQCILMTMKWHFLNV
jgi:hypothetical protein